MKGYPQVVQKKRRNSNQSPVGKEKTLRRNTLTQQGERNREEERGERRREREREVERTKH